MKNTSSWLKWRWSGGPSPGSWHAAFRTPSSNAERPHPGLELGRHGRKPDFDPTRCTVDRFDDLAVDLARRIAQRRHRDVDLQIAQDCRPEMRLHARLERGQRCQLALVHRAPDEFLLQDRESDWQRR